MEFHLHVVNKLPLLFFCIIGGELLLLQICLVYNLYDNFSFFWEERLFIPSFLNVNSANFLPASQYLSYINGELSDLTGEVEDLHLNKDSSMENGHYVEEVNTCLNIMLLNWSPN